MEASERIQWVLKHHIDLEPWTMIDLRDLRFSEKTWAVANNEVVRFYYDYNHYYDDEQNDNGEQEEEEDDDVEAEMEEEEEQEEYDKEGVQTENNEKAMSRDCEWNSDDDNILNIEDYDPYDNYITFLGFHPYKEVIFLAFPRLVGVAFHLKSSKVQYLGKTRPTEYTWAPTNGIYEAFPYTPCMIGELLKPGIENPRGH